ncbi:MAG: hypothetical protein IJO10_07290, partial [Clostridia bacterium]|nr:hypothetical protein [Clostridia bacterium]
PQNGSLSGKCKEEEEGISVDIPTDDDDAVARNGFVLRRCFFNGMPLGLFSFLFYAVQVPVSPSVQSGAAGR